MTDAVEAAELFDIDVDQFAGMLTLVAANRRGRFKRLDAAEAKAPEDAADRSRRDPDCSGDLLARPALAAEGFDGHDRGCRRRPVQVMGPGGAIVQAFHAFGWKRTTHLHTVLTAAPKAAATAVGVCPSTTTRRTSSARLCGVSRAF